MAHHLQKFQENGFKKEEMGKCAYDYRGQDGANTECKNIKSGNIYAFLYISLKIILYLFTDKCIIYTWYIMYVSSLYLKNELYAWYGLAFSMTAEAENSIYIKIYLKKISFY